MAVIILAAMFAAQSCAAQASPAAPFVRDAPADCVPQGRTWRSIASEVDRRRLRDWRDAWVEALAQARSEGHGDAIAAAGPLLDPDVGLDDPALAPGDYRCRTIKIGSRQPGVVPAFSDEGFVPCRIGAVDSRMTFARLEGPQRPIGRIYPDNELRSVFLGTLQLTDETRAYQYGVDPDRDMIGLVQRIDERRWRLVLPRPAHESLLDVVEIVPN
ncbi:MAG: DUF4893 domain-containing protein [Sphingomonas sp.]